METKHIWHLVGFTQEAIEGWIFSREMNDSYKSLNDTQRTTIFKEFKENYMYSKAIGNHRLGTFSSLEKAKDMINSENSDLHRYPTILIEKHVLDDVEGFCFGDSGYEYWYGINETWGDDGWIESSEYHEIDRPDYLIGVCGFA